MARFVDDTINRIKTEISLLRLGEQSARLLNLEMDPVKAKPLLLEFIRVYIEAVQASRVFFAAVLNGNIAKTCGRFIALLLTICPTSMLTFPKVSLR